MPAHISHGPRTIRILAALFAAVALSAGLAASVSTAAPTAAPAAGHAASTASAAGTAATATADATAFAVNSPAMVKAELIAVEYWSATPCSGQVSVSWGVLDPSLNATSNWWNPTEAYGNATANSQCTIVLNQYQRFDWPMFCSVMVHEIGHLTGHEHVLDKTSVMYPIYITPIAQCAGSAPDVAASAHAATVKTAKTRKAHKHHAASKARKHK
jgi:hypothetical protein